MNIGINLIKQFFLMRICTDISGFVNKSEVSSWPTINHETMFE
jgi:hypothetical protein